MTDPKLSCQDIIEMARHSIITLDDKEAEFAAQEALDAGLDPVDFIEKGFVEGMREIGDRFEEGKASLVQIFAASRIMDAGMNVLKPRLSKKDKGFCFFGNIAMNA
ncbi:B12-binding domain-containing protein [Methanolobus zinderi]|jgi:trimethylamine corrinoid protein|uniref:B12-binding domain-containing protein n=1 Tax=Methanolobus zinderi TaxID=536044 RepID=A0A7D5I0K4_9EURY|nr:B12-binding domain-containing protein [Methanolobus zinderi]KXS41779.1 MAG: dimethylamine corrinoid protein [Methanolobus sp. T82-4]QLC49866.1 B12-binding domain-containing protein [Methanolobus zinderi]